MKPSTITTFAEGPDGTRARQIEIGGATVLIRGERSLAVARAIAERFESSRAPRRPLGEGGCVRVDERGIWLLNKIASGWSSSAIRYDSWRELFFDWDFTLGHPQADKAGVYWPVEVRT